MIAEASNYRLTDPGSLPFHVTSYAAPIDHIGRTQLEDVQLFGERSRETTAVTSQAYCYEQLKHDPSTKTRLIKASYPASSLSFSCVVQETPRSMLAQPDGSMDLWRLLQLQTRSGPCDIGESLAACWCGVDFFVKWFRCSLGCRGLLTTRHFVSYACPANCFCVRAE